MTEIFRNLPWSISYDPATMLIYQRASDAPIDASKIKEGFLAIMNFVEKNKVKGILVDISRVKGTFSMLNDFIANVYIPKLISSEVTFSAMIVSNDIFTKFATDQLIQKVKSFEIRTFGKMADAEAWAIEKAKD